MSHSTAAGKAIGSIIFTIFLSLTVFAGTLSTITDESSVRGALPEIFDESLKQKYDTQDLEVVRRGLQSQCVFSDTVRQDFAGVSLDVDCESVKLGQAADLPALFTDTYIEQEYFRSYECPFIDCFTQASFGDKSVVFFSSHANSFFGMMMWLAIALAIVGIIIIFASLRHLFNAFRVIGIDMAVAGIPGFFITLLRPDFSGLSAGINALVDSAFAFMFTAYLTIFVIGIVLAIIGFALSRNKPKERKIQARRVSKSKARQRTSGARQS